MRVRVFWTALALLIAGSFFFSNAAACKIRTLSGHVTYRERTALPPSAVIVVRLVDVSRAEGKAITIAATSMTAQTQAPFPYQLRYDDSMLQTGNTYVLQAWITINRTLKFVSTDQNRVLTWAPNPTDIVVERIDAQKKTSVTTPTGRRKKLSR
jgi:putative lipoprotein